MEDAGCHGCWPRMVNTRGVPPKKTIKRLFFFGFPKKKGSAQSQDRNFLALSRWDRLRAGVYCTTGPSIVIAGGGGRCYVLMSRARR